MAIEQMNISLSPQMAKFIRAKVRAGNYTTASEVVRDAIRRMQDDDSARAERARLANFEASLPEAEREGIRRGVRQGIQDIELGRHDDYDEQGLKALGRTLVNSSARRVNRSKAG
jgi:putative addiction module CopG family antidote